MVGNSHVDLVEATAQLARRGHRLVLCTGGPTLLGQLVAADRIDEICLTLSPVVGGDRLPLSVSVPHSETVSWSLQHVLNDGDFLFLRYVRGAR